MARTALAIGGVLLIAAASAYALGWLRVSEQSIDAPDLVPSDFVELKMATGRLWVARHETTVAQWLACVHDNACPEIQLDQQKLDHPVTGVNLDDVSAYLHWYSNRFQTPVRLPTREEWLQLAADDAPQPRTKLFDDPRLAWAADYDLTAVPQSRVTEPGGSFGSNQYGIHDLKGNVWEWTSSCQVDMDGFPVNVYGCITGRYAMGEPAAVLSERLRTPGNAGCSGNQPPANVGLRLVWAN